VLWNVWRQITPRFLFGGLRVGMFPLCSSLCLSICLSLIDLGQISQSPRSSAFSTPGKPRNWPRSVRSAACPHSQTPSMRHVFAHHTHHASAAPFVCFICRRVCPSQSKPQAHPSVYPTPHSHIDPAIGRSASARTQMNECQGERGGAWASEACASGSWEADVMERMGGEWMM